MEYTNAMNPNHSWKLYSQNDEVWQAMLDDCSKAQKSIVLEQYHFVNDDFGQKLVRICKERALAGVKVRFLWDATGSFTFWGSNLIEELRKSGIELLFWKTLIPSFFKAQNFRSWYFRNHRRTLVIDDTIGYTGSICVDQVLKNWRDTNVRIIGPIVREMRLAFEQMWFRALNAQIIRYQHLPKSSEFRYVTNYPAPGRRHIYSELVKAIRKAKKNIYITTPYFVPTHRLLRTMKASAKRGVDVRLILPEHSDHYAVDLGARAFFTTLLKSGIKIFLYKGNMIHSKAITIDDTWSTVGSMNLDNISLLYNFEANIVTTNDNFSRELKAHFIEDLEESQQVHLKDWQKRSFFQKVLEKLAHLVKKFL
jgi:cardiolipin synthase